MRKLASRVATAVLILAAITWGVYSWWRDPWGWRRRARSRPTDNKAYRSAAIPQELPSPNVSLEIDGRWEGTVAYHGTPLIFSVRLYNQRASNANLQNLANEAYIEELRAKAAAGEIPKEYAERESARSSKKEEVRPVRLGDDANGWWQFVHLGERIPGGNLQPLPWPVKFLALPQDNTLSLEARSTAELEFGLGPDAAPQIPLGEHQIVAVLEVPDRASLPADHWRGRAESTPAKFNIVPKPARLSLEEEEKMSLQLGRYFNAAGEPAKATEYARKALAANAKSIPALILLGNAQENQGDYRGALETYGAAQRELYREYPRAIEPPLYLAYRISGLIDKLEARP